MKIFANPHSWATVLLVGVFAAWASEEADAQVPSYLDPSRKPTVSPYINLLRSGSSPGINYYGIVRPEIAITNSLNRLQGQQTELANQQIELETSSTLPPTGHPSRFLTHSRYFMTSGGAKGGTVSPAASPIVTKGSKR